MNDALYYYCELLLNDEKLDKQIAKALTAIKFDVSMVELERAIMEHERAFHLQLLVETIVNGDLN